MLGCLLAILAMAAAANLLLRMVDAKEECHSASPFVEFGGSSPQHLRVFVADLPPKYNQDLYNEYNDFSYYERMSWDSPFGSPNPHGGRTIWNTNQVCHSSRIGCGSWAVKGWVWIMGGGTGCVEAGFASSWCTERDDAHLDLPMMFVYGTGTGCGQAVRYFHSVH